MNVQDSVLQIRGTMPENGAATQAFSIGSELLQHGYKVEFASAGGKIADQIIDLGLSHSEIPALAGRSPGAVIRAIWFLRDLLVVKKINIVHAHNCAVLFLTAAAALSVGRFKQTKFFLSVHGVEVRPRYFFRNVVFPLAQFATIFPVSSYTADLLRRYGVSRRRMIITYNGIDLARFDVNKKARFRRECCSELVIPEDSLIIGLVGRQNGVKGHRDAIKVFGRLYPEFPNAYLVLVGAGEEEASNKDLAVDLNISDRVRFTGFRADVERFHAAFDLLTLFSRKGYEMFPCVLLEGMAFGVPFISVDTTGVPELAEGGRGIICRCGDLEGYEDAVRSLLSSADKRESMGLVGLNAMRNLFNIGVVTKAIREQYLK